MDGGSILGVLMVQKLMSVSTGVNLPAAEVPSTWRDVIGDRRCRASTWLRRRLNLSFDNHALHVWHCGIAEIPENALETRVLETCDATSVNRCRL